MELLVLGCIVTVFILIIFGILLFAIFQELDNDAARLGAISCLFLIGIIAYASIFLIINESYKWGARDHFLGKVKVEIREAAPVKEDIIYIERN